MAFHAYIASSDKPLKLPFEKGFTSVTWNFFEAGHGKGAADGIGGVLKRTADKLVAQGIDIPNAKALFENLRGNTGVNLYYIEESRIQEFSKIPDLTTVTGTMRIHQVISTKPMSITYRDVSCTCSTANLPCNCHSSRSHSFSDHLPDVPCIEATANNDLKPLSPEMPAIGQFCVVRYEGEAYPRKILDMDETYAQVSCMHKVGKNRYFWPTLLPDILHYLYEDVLGLIPEPIPVTGLHMQVEPAIWKKISELL